MLEAYKNFWKKYVDFEGRTTLSEWWWVTLCNFIIFLLLFISLSFSFVINGFEVITNYEVIIISFISIYLLIILLPSITMNVRRLRDAGFHWALIFISFVPYIGGLILLILLQMPSKSRMNNKEMK